MLFLTYCKSLFSSVRTNFSPYHLFPMFFSTPQGPCSITFMVYIFFQLHQQQDIKNLLTYFLHHLHFIWFNFLILNQFSFFKQQYFCIPESIPMSLLTECPVESRLMKFFSLFENIIKLPAKIKLLISRLSLNLVAPTFLTTLANGIIPLKK